MKKFWKFIVIGICIIVTACVFMLRNNHNADISVFDLDVGTPNIERFDDDASAFIGNDGLPDINNNRKILGNGELVINYQWVAGPYAGALRDNLSDSDIANGVKISPFIPGKWNRVGPNTLIFSPTTPWPANQKFRVSVSPRMTNRDMRIKSHHKSFTTEQIIAKIDGFNIYPAPNTPGHVVAVGIISTNWPIANTPIDDRITIRHNGKSIDFTTKMDRFRKTIIITSSPIAVTDVAQRVRITVRPLNAANGDAHTKKLSANATIESTDNFFKVSKIDATVADDARGDAHQIILLNLTAAAQNGTKWSDIINAYLLPEFADDSDTDTPHEWKTDEVTSQVIKKSAPIKLMPMNIATPNGVHQYAFSFDAPIRNSRQMFVSVNPGARSSGGFTMKNAISRVMDIPYPPRSVNITGRGALLAMGGNREITITARGGVDMAYVNLYKVAASEINHLISQTYNVFAQNLDFRDWSFGAYDMATVYQKKVPFADTSMTRTNYASVNLGDYLDRDARDKTGIFIVSVAPDANAAEYADKRLILMTNLGLIRKQNLDGTTALFVSNLSIGGGADDVEVSVLGRNGRAIWAGRTDSNGHVDIPKLDADEYRNEKEPVAIVARSGDDVSFIPYDSYSTHVEYSRFDIDGTYDTNTNPISAYVFSDRGIYRPGESAVIGAIVKNRSFTPMDGIPVKITVTDSRNRDVYENIMSLTSDGMIDAKYNIPDTATIGEYMVRVYSLNNKNREQDILGTTTIRVEEFVPDTMKISATITGAGTDSWIESQNINATVAMRNLFGTPATNRRISARAVLRPIDFTFPQYADYTFTTNYIGGTGLAENTITRTQTLTTNPADTTTDEFGNAILPIVFDGVPVDGTYMLTLNINGFVDESGKSVQTTITSRVSDYKYLIGWKSNSGLSYINRDDARNIHFIALDANANITNVSDLTVRMIRRENLTSLIKDSNGYYKYNTVTRDNVIAERPFAIGDAGARVSLNTSRGGTYFIQVIDASNRTLANIEYFVADSADTAMQSAQNAEMKLKLSAPEYAPGTDVVFSITAPYTGTGLITIERDRVYAYKWFTMDSSTSVQHIKLPDDFSGTGYINVSFVRNINSPDIFTTPYAYAVAPFRADTSKRKIGVKLTAPDVVRNNALRVQYETTQDAKIMIFAINAGILQVARHATPDPFAYFFRKSALQVDTYQILSLLLPEFGVFGEFAKTGGGDWFDNGGELRAPLTNPFGRKTNQPVAFYSEIMETHANVPGEIEFQIPEYFNGAVRIFAVAANDSAIGSTGTETRVQSPVIISTTAPSVVAPGDTFDINAVISNMTMASGPDATADITATVSENLAINGEAHTTMHVPENTEQLWKFGVTAGEILGNAQIAINTVIMDANGTPRSQRTIPGDITIRPISPIDGDIRFGTIESKTHSIKKFRMDMYPEFATRKIYLSRGANALMNPIAQYLAQYDHPCTEQITSRGLAQIAVPDVFKDNISDTIAELKNRQNDDGSFDLYSGGATGHNNETDSDAAMLTAYVANFLMIANAHGATVPRAMVSRAMDFLRTFAGATITDAAHAHAAALAIYIATANGYITTGYIDAWEEYANKNIKNWQSGIMGAYIAASYKILKQNQKADDLIAKYRKNGNRFIYTGEFDNSVANDAMYEYLMATHFDTAADYNNAAIKSYIDSGNYTSFTSGMVIMALMGAPQVDDMPQITITTDNGTQIPTPPAANGAIVADVPDDATRINIKCDTCDRGNPVFYTLWQSGIPKNVMAKSNGLDITREYFDDAGNRITSGHVGDTITVKITIRARGRTDNVPNVAIVDLVPGGFISGNISGEFDFAESRSDRVVIYTTAQRTARTITYTAQLGTAGIFQIPAIRANAMNNPQIYAVGHTGGTFTVLNATNEQDI
ncbi:MAG: alpha-2-macroglobulin family protein [Alphaproteobacteria bacterium]|nr:alpha-2-macroglobulin family protein [Alphaproteobacteria bacterium]